MLELLRVIANEWMKLLRRRRLWVAGILLILTIGLFGVTTWHDHRNEIRYNPIDNTKQAIAMTQQRIQDLNNQPASTQRDAELNGLKQQLQSMQQDLVQMQASTSSDWRAPVQQQLASMKQSISQLQSQKQTPDVESQIGDMQTQVMQLQYELDNNVPPNEQMASHPYRSILGFTDIALQIFIPLLIIILVGDMVSGEATSGSIKLLLVRPVSRSKILLGKWIVSLSSSMLMTLLFFAGSWLTAVVIEGFGDALQPIITGVTYTFETVFQPGAMQPNVYLIPHLDHAHVMSQTHFFIDTVLLSLLATMTVATVAFFCSTFFKSAMASTAVAMGIVVVGFVVEHLAQHQSWVGWLLSTHLNLGGDWSGEVSRLTNQSMTLTYGLIVLAIWAVLALAISLWRFARRDVLNA